MVHSFLLRPFDEAAQATHYQAILAALAPCLPAPALLLGNVPVAPLLPPLAAVLVWPRGIVLLLPVPRGGRLHIPALRYGAWQLEGQALTAPTADNLFAYYQQQKSDLARWLGEQLGVAPTALPPITGLVVFAEATTFSAQVEQQLGQQAATDDFQLLADLSQLPYRLRPRPDQRDVLRPEWLTQWMQRLATTATPPTPAPPDAQSGYWPQKIRQLWRWLGADDLPADPPYSPPPPDGARHEQLRRELQLKFRQQQQAHADREAAWEHRLDQLRQQLAQVTTRTDQGEKAALEAALRTARAEAAARNQELDHRIQQLTQLIGRLQPLPTAGPATGSRPLPAAPKPAATGRAVPPRLRRQQVVATVLVAGGLAAGTWGLVRLMPPAEVATKAAAPRSLPLLAASYSPPPTTDSVALDAYVDGEEAAETDSYLFSTDSAGEDGPETLPEPTPDHALEAAEPQPETPALGEAAQPDPTQQEPDSTLEVSEEPSPQP